MVAADPMALLLAKPPQQMGADICVGNTQRFGVPMFCGGPAAAYLATSEKYLRKMPGRIIGISKDTEESDAYRLTLQTREQHIRLDKATSNVCTAQALLANATAFYAIYHKKSGLLEIAGRIRSMAAAFSSAMEHCLGLEVDIFLAYVRTFFAALLKTYPHFGKIMVSWVAWFSRFLRYQRRGTALIWIRAPSMSERKKI